MILVQFTDQKKKEKLTPYLQVHVSYSLQTLSDVLAWQDGYTENVIETFN